MTRIRRENTASRRPRYPPAMRQKPSTIPVREVSWFLLGHCTRRSSATTPRRKVETRPPSRSSSVTTGLAGRRGALQAHGLAARRRGDDGVRPPRVLGRRAGGHLGPRLGHARPVGRWVVPAGVGVGGQTGGGESGRPALGLALLGPLAVACHGGRRGASARLAVRGVLPAPATVLARLEAVRRVPLRLLGLVVAALALLAGKRHGDSDISASHGSSFCVGTVPGRRTAARMARERISLAQPARRSKATVLSCSATMAQPGAPPWRRASATAVGPGRPRPPGWPSRASWKSTTPPGLDPRGEGIPVGPGASLRVIAVDEHEVDASVPAHRAPRRS